MTSTDWMQPILVLAIGAIAGFVVIRFSRKSTMKPRTTSPSSELEAILEQLRTLDESSDERYALELQGAELLRKIETQPVPQEKTTRHDGVKGFLWGTAATTVVALLIVTVTRSSNERAEIASAAPVTPPDIAAGPGIAGPGVAGILTLDESVASRVATPAVVFLIARGDAETMGHPIAAKRLDVQSFPTSFQLTDADSMMGEPLPSRMRLEARIDDDGDVVTRNDTDPIGFVDAVSPGEMSLRLVLK